MYSKEQVLKEWDKIKAYDILDTIEELETLFREKPYGKCMRKYTAYFFFPYQAVNPPIYLTYQYP